VVGASLGGVEALSRLAQGLPADFPAPVFMVLHIDGHRSILPELLTARGLLPARHAQDGERIAPGNIYIAPPDHHMLIEGEHMRTVRGPKENHSRPAVDPLFRSAAQTWGSAVIGVVLTGTLDDGTAGLQAIKARGGTAVVQSPDDAFARGMPESALAYVAVDHCVPLASMPALLHRLAAVGPPVPPILALEPDPGEPWLMDREGANMERLEKTADPSTYVCPDCHGSLWAVRDAKPARFRCHTGHGYTVRSLEHALAGNADEAMWNAIRALQERRILLERMMEELSDNRASEAAAIAVDVEALQDHVTTLRSVARRMPGTVDRHRMPS
jgi:two-component system chemotaxis response regulator CheB